MEYTKEQLRALYLKLPENVKEVLNSEDTLDKTEAIGKKFNLHIDKTGALSKDIGQLILGALKPGEFIAQLSRDLKMPIDQVQPIAKEVNEQIFKPIRESLKKIHGLDGSQTIEQVTSAPPNLLPKIDDFDNRLSKYLSSTPNEAKNSNPTPIYTQDPYREPAN
jgi:hypothetical protein